jgi:hypothetical protein
MNKYDFEENEYEFKIIQDALESSLKIDEIKELIRRKKHRELNLQLNIHFMKYFRDKFEIPFMLSDWWWNMLTPPELYKNKNDFDYFILGYEVLDNHFAQNFDFMLLSNDIEMFGKAWGLQYPYYFLKESGLIDEGTYMLMLENIEGIKHFFLKNTYENLWKASFVFSWPEIYKFDPSEEHVFRSTFTNDFDSVAELLENYIDDHYMSLPTRIQHVIDEKYPEDISFPQLDDWEEESMELPFEREGPKTGRNDPCPCGSGRKYKHCCLH